MYSVLYTSMVVTQSPYTVMLRYSAMLLYYTITLAHYHYYAMLLHYTVTGMPPYHAMRTQHASCHKISVFILV